MGFLALILGGAVVGFLPNVLFVVGGVLLGIAAPWLSKKPLRGPPPKSPEGRIAAIVIYEAFAVILVSYSANNFLDGHNLLLEGATTLSFATFLIAFGYQIVAEVSYRASNKDKNGKHIGDDEQS